MEAASYVVEALENRRLLSVTSIPTVPTPAAAWTFDEGTGTTAADSSGNGHTVTLSAGASWTAGNVGTHALSVNGTSTGVATATGPVVDTAGSFTVSAWVDLSVVSGYETVVSIAGTNVAGFYLGLRQDTGAFSFARIPSDTDTNATVIAASSAPLANTWYHIVGVDDATAGTLALYVDGQPMGSVAFTSGWTATGNTLIGQGFYNGAETDDVNGSIDNVEFFSSALSAAQVAALDQPAAYSFDDGSGSTAADVSGHGNTLTLGAGASWATGNIGSNSLAVNGSATGNASFAAPVINTAQSFSVSAWVQLNSVSTTQTFVSIDGAHTSAFYLQFRSDTGEFAFTRLASDSDTAQSFQANGTLTPSTGVWYNLIGMNDVATGQILLYVNGSLQSTVSYTGGWQGIGATVIGGGEFNGARSDFVNGAIDDVHFYNSPVSAGDAAIIGTGGNSTINVATGSSGATVSPDLFGAFMEDINYGGEGGIYNDEIRNSGFNDSTNALNAWAAVKGSGVTDSLTSDATTGPTTALTESGKLTITSGVSATARAGISNAGYFGVAIAPSTSYTVDFYAKASAGFTGPLTVDLESTTGTVFATATITSITSSWAEYTATLTTGVNTPTTSTNLLVISTKSASANGKTLWFGASYLYPPSYEGQANHLRTDLMQMLAALHPAIFRIPGGNYLEGNTYADHFEWSNTIGPVQDRPGHLNSAWGYWSTDGMGLDEYLQMAEEVGASPILAVYAGYTLNGTSDTGTTLANDVTDAVNELHYVLDPVTTSWGAERAANGHPAPYKVQYVEVGNEDFFSSTYATRYPLFYNAIHAAFPALKIVATTTSTGGSPFDVLDEHFYESPAWFEANSNYFDNVARGSYQVFIGEYASNEGAPTNDMNSALGDASWLLGLERNSDLVTMSSYAPLWANVNGLQWTPDLIGFNNTSAYGSPSYYAQLILSQNHGTTVVSDTVSGATGLETLVTKTGSTYYLTVINTIGTANTASIDLAGVTAVSSTATVTTMSSLASSATNSITNPTNIVPVTSTVSGVGPNFSYAFPGYSITVLQFNATVDTPTVATPAAADPVPVTGTTTALSVLGADAMGESALTYIWSDTGPGAVNYSVNSTNAAKNSLATFTAAGTYNFTVTITNPTVGTSTTSSVSVVVNQTASGGFAVTPSAATVVPGGTVQFTAGMIDQFGNSIAAQSAITWSIVSGNGTINSAGVYTAGATPSVVTVRGTTADGTFATATVTIPTAVAWYKADASSGTTLADSSGNNETATLTGAAAFGAGVSGNALSLTGGSATLPAGIVSSLKDFTISAWINVSTLANWARVFDFGSGTTSYMFLTPDAGGTNELRFAITTSGYANEQQLNGPAITPGVWTHVAVTLAGNTATLYVDGVAVATNTGMTIHPSALGVTTQDYLGKSQFTGDPSFSGSIDDFRIYGQALSAAQILQLAAPSVVNAPAASAAPVVTTQTVLSVLGADVTAGEAALIYTWTTMGTPPAAVVFSANGTNAAKNTTATFTQAGTYNFLVTMTNPGGVSTTSTVAVIVAQAVTTITSVPSPTFLYAGASEQLTATAFDQFGNAFLAPPTFAWSLTSGTGSVTPAGVYTAPLTATTAVLQVSVGAVIASATLHTVTALLGDADLSGTVDRTDLNIILSHLGVVTSSWTSGNFDGAPTVDLTDLNDVLNHLGTTVTIPTAIVEPPASSGNDPTSDDPTSGGTVPVTTTTTPPVTVPVSATPPVPTIPIPPTTPVTPATPPVVVTPPTSTTTSVTPPVAVPPISTVDPGTLPPVPSLPSVVPAVTIDENMGPPLVGAAVHPVTDSPLQSPFSIRVYVQKVAVVMWRDGARFIRAFPLGKKKF
jgi:alpha-L-arabinofuranosidase